MNELIIDPEFESLIPPLADEEFKMLEQNILKDGCLHELIVTTVDGKTVIVDGHNRFNICKKHSIKFRVTEKTFPDRQSAKIWIYSNQLGRRNLQPFQRVEIVLGLEELYRGQAKERQSMAGGDKRSEQAKSLVLTSAQAIQEKGKTRDKLAKLAGVGRDSVTKGKVIAEKADNATKEKLRTGEITINKAYTDILIAESKGEKQKCRLCGQEKTIDQYYAGRRACKQCEDELQRLRNKKEEAEKVSSQSDSGKHDSLQTAKAANNKLITETLRTIQDPEIAGNVKITSDFRAMELANHITVFAHTLPAYTNGDDSVKKASDENKKKITIAIQELEATVNSIKKYLI